MLICRSRKGLWTILAATTIVALGAAGCGEESDEDRVRSTIEQLQDDFASGRFKKVCDAMSDRSKQQVGRVGHDRKPTTCTRDIQALLGGIVQQASFAVDQVPDIRRLPKPEVTSVDITGDRAVARTSLDGNPLDIPLVERNGSWKLDDFFVITGPVRPDLD